VNASTTRSHVSASDDLHRRRRRRPHGVRM